MKCFETGKQIYLTPQSAHDALAKMNRHASRNRRHGLSRCSICDEPISEFRQALGAIHCLDHAAELEQRRGLR